MGMAAAMAVAVIMAAAMDMAVQAIRRASEAAG
jgi:hypothetical protein